MKKIFVCGFSQESNSFNPALSDYEVFAKNGIFKGGGLPEGKTCLPPADGMLKVLSEAGFDVHCGVIMRAGSGGPIRQEVADDFLEKTLADLRKIRPDGVAIAMHGATVSDKNEDVCGQILAAIRGEVGEKVPISASFDLHANITEKVARSADFVSGFQTYPHLDQVETGERAARRLVETLSGEKIFVYRKAIPMIAPAGGYTTEKGALNEIVRYAKGLIQSRKIVDYSLFEVQPWLDVKEMASVVIVMARDEKTARDVAEELAEKNRAIRKELQGPALFSIEEVIEKALTNKTGKPVVLVDSDDSPNAGSTGDSALVVEKLLPYCETLSAAACVLDVSAAEKAFSLGVGARADFTLGATKAPLLTAPVTVRDAEVVGLYEGHFIMQGPQEAGRQRNIGPTAVLQKGGLRIHVFSLSSNAGDLNFYKSFGTDPQACDLVSVKACTSFRAGYEPIAAEICSTHTAGAAGSRLTELPFRNRPVPLYPFEEI